MKTLQITVLLGLFTSAVFAGGWTRENAWYGTLLDELKAKESVLVQWEDNGGVRIHTVSRKQAEADLKWDGRAEPPLPFGKALKIVQSHLQAENPGYSDFRISHSSLSPYATPTPGSNWCWRFCMRTDVPMEGGREWSYYLLVVLLMDGTVLEPEIYTKPVPPEKAPESTPPDGLGAGSSNGSPVDAAGGAELSDAQKRLKAIIVPEVDFRQANIWDVIAFMDKVVKDFGTGPETRDESRIRIKGDKSIQPDELKHGYRNDTPCLSFAARDIPLLTLVKLMAKISSLKYVVEGNVVTFTRPARQAGK